MQCCDTRRSAPSVEGRIDWSPRAQERTRRASRRQRVGGEAGHARWSGLRIHVVLRETTAYASTTPIDHRLVGDETLLTNGCGGLTQSLVLGVVPDLLGARHRSNYYVSSSWLSSRGLQEYRIENSFAVNALGPGCSPFAKDPPQLCYSTNCK